MLRYLITMVLVVLATAKTFSQIYNSQDGLKYRFFENECVVLTENVDSILLEQQTAEIVTKLKKSFAKDHRQLSKDSVAQLLEDTYYYRVFYYEIVSETKDTIYLKPRKEKLVQVLILLHDDLEIGRWGNIGSLEQRLRRGNPIRSLFIKRTTFDVRMSPNNKNYYEQLLSKHIFAIKGYVEDNIGFDHYWFSINTDSRLEKYLNLDIL